MDIHEGAHVQDRAGFAEIGHSGEGPSPVSLPAKERAAVCSLQVSSAEPPPRGKNNASHGKRFMQRCEWQEDNENQSGEAKV
jgi:hypothetical protein